MSSALAASYEVSTEAELRQAILSANADGDASSTITLTADIAITDPAAFAQATKALTIDVGAFSLSAVMAAGNLAGTSLSFLGGPLQVAGTAGGGFTGGSARSSASNAAGGAGIALVDGNLDNGTTLVGGGGGFNGATGGGRSGNGGVGATLANSTLLNRGAVSGGSGGDFDARNGAGTGATRIAGNGGTGLVMTGGALDNQGVIRGGDAGSMTRLPTSGDNSYGGAGGIGAELSAGTHANSGTIVGGKGGQGGNKGSGPGAGAGGSGVILGGGATLVNRVGGTVTGGEGVISLPNGGPASAGGVGARVAGATLQNYGTITGGSSGSTSVSGGIAIVGSGGAVIINDGSIVGGTRSNGTFNTYGVSFSGSNNLLELRSNSSITGVVLGGATDILALGGSTNASFDVSQIGLAVQYRSFGAYHKLGASTWTLSGATAAVTPWTLREGVLSVSADGNLGASTGRLTFDGGTLEVTGTSYSGTGRPITLAAGGGGIDIDAAANVFTIASVIDGAGGLAKLGDGTLVFTADNTYVGGTILSAGTLQLGNGGTAGNIASGALTNHGSLVINRSNDMAISGAISGSGSVSQVGAGITTLGGINSYSGGTVISSGTLRGSATSFGSGVILDNSALVLEQLGNGTLDNLVTGFGTLAKQGSGTLALTAANSYTGATLVNAGSLYINGNQSAANGLTTVQTGGTLGGTGTIGGAVAVADGALAPGAGGVGTLTILGGLTLGANAVLNFELGDAGAFVGGGGGAFNDLLEVTGNLTLDGTLTVAASAGGTYGPGFYRLINYTGTLTDNTLELGAMPAGTTQSLQTSIGGQVNLINTQGMVLRWWDGDAGVRNDAIVAGGAGTWLADAMGTNINWTDQSGTPNGSFLDSAFAMFTGAPGTVTVDDTIGAVRVAGMQFSVDGYRIEGDAITLIAGANTVRVGDGTGAGAGMRATIAAELTGNGRLVKADSGTLVLTATNSYAGGTTISGGTLQLGDGNAGGSLTGSVANDGTLAFNRSDAVTFGGAISGTGSVSQRGTGTTTLSGVNTYGGGTTIVAGTLTGSATSFGSGSIHNDAALVIQQPVDAEFANAISGSGTFTKQGAGVLTLTGNSTHTGITTIAAGTLQLGNGGTSGSLMGNIANIGTLAFNRSDATTYAGNISGTGSLWHTGTGVTTLTGIDTSGELRVLAGELRLAGGGQITRTGAHVFYMQGPSATLTVTGAGSFVGGSALRLWVGNSTQGGGTLNVEAGADVAVGDVYVGRGLGGALHAIANVSGAGSTLNSSGTFYQGFGAAAGSRSEVNVTAGGAVSSASHLVGSANGRGEQTTRVSGGGSTWTNTGALDLYSGSLSVMEGGSYSTGSARIGGVQGSPASNTGSVLVSGEGSRFTSTGVLNLGTSNTTQGITTLSDGGTLVAGGALVLGQVAGGTGTLNIGGAVGESALAAGTLSASSITFGPGTGMVNFNHIDADHDFATVITGNGTVNQVGPGTTDLTGNSSSFAGATNVHGGTLRVNGTLGNTSSTLNVLSGGTLGGSGVIGGAVTVASGGTLAPGNSPGTLTMGTLVLNSGSLLDFELGAHSVVGGALNDLVNVNGDLTLDGTLNVTQAAGGVFDVGVYRLINYTGTLTNNNTLDLGTLPAGSNAAGIVVQTEVAKQVNLINTAGLSFRFWDGPVGHGNGAFDGNDGAWLATSDNNWTIFDPFANGAWEDTAFAVFQGTPGTVMVDDSAGAVRFSGAQFLVDGYVVNGPGTLNTDTAQTLIRVGDGTAAGAAMTTTINAAIHGSGGLVKADAGTLVLGGDNGYTGGTTIMTGVLQLGAGGTTGSIVDSALVNGGTLAFNRSDAVRFGGAISGTGAVTQMGSGTTTLGGVNTYQGGTGITAGTLAGTASSFGDGEIFTAAAGTLRIDQATGATMANTFTGGGTLVKQGAGALDLSGDSGSFAGTTQVTGGTLRVNGTLGDAASTVHVSNGATLGGAGTIGGAVTVTDGRLAAGNSPGTLSIAGDLTLNAASILDFELGEAGVAGGALNDLILVGGNLTLDGTLHVSPSAGGTYGAGIYRLISYTGALTNNGLDLGLLPAGSSNFLQTVIANQVNLVNTAGMVLRWWDGDAGIRHDGLIAGGTGTWLADAAGTNINWTDHSGTPNGAFLDAAFAMFTGAPGTVTVDDSIGTVRVSGMQFSVDGYRIQGDAITLIAGVNTVRVGDGTAASAGMRATIASELTGSGGLDKGDGGTLVLTANNSYTGGTTIAAGTLIGSATSFGSGALTNHAALVIDQASDAAFANAINGSGRFTKTGAGLLNLTGTSTLSGATMVAAGTLAVNGALAQSAVTVAQGATLAGNGTVGATTLQTGATLVPGTGSGIGIGTLTVNGSYTQAAGAVYRAEVDPASTSASDRIAVHGSASLDAGAVLDVAKSAPGSYSLGTQYTVLSTTLGVTGTYTLSGETDLSAFVGLVARYDANNVYLVAQQMRALDSAAGTPNQNTTAQAIDTLPPGHGLRDIVPFLPNEAAARAALDQLSGELHASARTALLEDSRFVREAANDRLLDTMCAPGADARTTSPQAHPPRPAADCAPSTGNAPWVRLYGSSGHVSGDGNAQRIDRRIGGYFVGMDTALASGWRIGGVVGYSRSTTQGRLDVSSHSDNYHVGIYGGQQWGNTSLRLGASRTWHALQTQRSVRFAGFTDRADAQYDAATTQVFGEAGVRMALGAAALEPFAGLAHVKLKADAFQETGGLAALHGAGGHTSTTFSTLGVRGAWSLNNTMQLRGMVGWRHALGDVMPSSTHAFAGGAPLTVHGVPLAKDVVVLEAGIDVRLRTDLRLNVAYSGQAGSGLVDHGLKVSLGWTF